MVEITSLAKRDEQVTLQVCPHPFMMRRDTLYVNPGTSLKEIMLSTGLSVSPIIDTRVFVNDLLVVREDWDKVCPRDGDLVAIRVVPHGGGGGKSIFRWLLTIVVMVVAWYAGAALGAMGGGAGLFGIGATAWTGIIGMVGMLAVNAIFPPAQASISARSTDTEKSDNYSIENARNTVNRFGVVPQLLGTKRIVPPMGAMAYTEISGDDQFLRLCFNIGTGPVSIASMKIGEKAVANYEEVETEVREGFDSDIPITLYPSDVYEDQLSYELKFATGWVQDTTQPNADEISIDITLSEGLCRYDDMGEKNSLTVAFEVEISPTGENDWTLMASPLRRAKEVKVLRIFTKFLTPARAQYDIRVRRLTQDYDDEKYLDASYWTVLRTITLEDPISETGIAKVAMRIKASGQLNGIVDEFNCVGSTVCNDWDEATSTWIERATNNPASLFRFVLQGHANKRPLTDSRIDLDALQTWHVNCATNGYTFNEYVDYQSSVLDMLNMLCACSKAALSYKDGKYGVIEDTFDKVPVQHFSQRNSWSFSGNKTFYHPPHALRITFLNEDEDFQEDELIVLDNGYQINGLDAFGNSHPEYPEATEFEMLELPGVTNPTQVWNLGRYHLAVSKYRTEKFTFNTDVENLVCTRGDLIRFSHDIMSETVAVGRVKEVETDSNGDVISVVMDELMPMEEESGSLLDYVIRFRLKDGTSAIYSVENTALDSDRNEKELIFVTPISTNKPEVGNLGLFGEAGEESMELLVKMIKPGKDLSASLECVSYAKDEIEAFLAGVAPPHSSNLNPTITIPDVQIAYVRSNEYAMLRSSDGSLVPRILVGLIPLSSRDLTNVSAIECQVRLGEEWESGTSEESSWDSSTTETWAVGTWTSMPDLPKDSTAVSIMDVEEGEIYDFRIRYKGKDGKIGDWAEYNDYTVIGKSTPPAVPTSLSATQIELAIQLSWKNPGVPDFAYTGIWRNTTDDFPGGDPNFVVSGGPAETMVYVDEGITLGVTYYYWFASYDTAGNVSSQTSSVNSSSKGVLASHIATGTLAADVRISVGDNVEIDANDECYRVFADEVTIETGVNDKLDWYEYDTSSTEMTATLTAGEYTPAELAAHVQTKMRAAGDDNTTVTYNSITRKITIANSTLDVFELWWESGTNSATTCGEALGFSITIDDVGALTYTADRPCCLRCLMGKLF